MSSDLVGVGAGAMGLADWLGAIRVVVGGAPVGEYAGGKVGSGRVEQASGLVAGGKGAGDAEAFAGLGKGCGPSFATVHVLAAVRPAGPFEGVVDTLIAFAFLGVSAWSRSSSRLTLGFRDGTQYGGTTSKEGHDSEKVAADTDLILIESASFFFKSCVR